MAKAGIVPGCGECDVEHDGAEDGHCCTVLLCDTHLAAKDMKALLSDWIADPVVCMAISKSCIQVGGCRCLYCRTKALLR